MLTLKHIISALLVPATYIIKFTNILPFGSQDSNQITVLFRGHKIGSNERRIPHNIIQLTRRNHLIPIHPQCVALVNIVVGLKRKRIEVEADDFIRFLHHLGLSNPKGRLCHGASKIVDFYAVELVDGDLDGFRHFSNYAVIPINNSQRFVFQATQAGV